MNDVIADMIARIRNGQQRKLLNVSVPYSKFREQVLKVMIDEGYIESCEKKSISKGIDSLEVRLKYLRDGTPVIQEIKKVSKLGRRIYTKITDLKAHYNNLGVVILSTSHGVMSDAKARKAKVGGEIICQVF